MVLRHLNRNSEPQASIESGQYTLQYVPAICSLVMEVRGILQSGVICGVAFVSCCQYETSVTGSMVRTSHEKVLLAMT
jgi:hypothetical protein